MDIDAQPTDWGPDFFGMPIARWVNEKLPALRESGNGPIELIQRAGEMIFVPAQWAHAVLNVADVVGVSAQLVSTPAQQLQQVRQAGVTLAELVDKKTSQSY